MRLFVVMLSAALVAVLLPLVASAADPDLTIGFKRTFHSEILGEDRELWVYLPDTYDGSPESTFPLLVVLDARGSFRTTAALVHSLARGRALPPMIVVGDGPLRRAVARWPNRPYPYACLGEGLERTGKLEEALLQMERALEMAKAENEADIPYFQGMIDRVRAALAENGAVVPGLPANR